MAGAQPQRQAIPTADVSLSFPRWAELDPAARRLQADERDAMLTERALGRERAPSLVLRRCLPLGEARDGNGLYGLLPVPEVSVS